MVEPLLSGIVLGLVPITITGLLVTAYLQCDSTIGTGFNRKARTMQPSHKYINLTYFTTLLLKYRAYASMRLTLIMLTQVEAKI